MALSRFIDVPPSFVSKMASGEKSIPAEHCRAIVEFTEGQVTVQEMRSDWFKYWPELAPALANTTQPATDPVAEPDAMRSGLIRRHDNRREHDHTEGGRRGATQFPPNTDSASVGV